jgi:hypothetical protein
MLIISFKVDPPLILFLKHIKAFYYTYKVTLKYLSLLILLLFIYIVINLFFIFLINNLYFIIYTCFSLSFIKLKNVILAYY